MEREMNVGATPNVMARRKLRPRVLLRALSIVPTAAPDAASIKTGAEEQEPLISVWWDDPPYANP